MPKAEREKFTEDKGSSNAPKANPDLNKLIEWLTDAEGSTSETEYREVSEEDYDFYAGFQDTDDVIASLEGQNRPATTYNEVKPKIDMLIGLAAQMKYEPTVLPVGIEDEPLVEVMNGAMPHFR